MITMTTNFGVEQQGELIVRVLREVDRPVVVLEPEQPVVLEGQLDVNNNKYHKVLNFSFLKWRPFLSMQSIIPMCVIFIKLHFFANYHV